ncbi:efflux RND transporter periplasmic adaptor subunit [Flammeovirgaceae bacterium SG7u.111]|nr:efflux RND transporter periplasmic adaptor subunit [Flammeovirgaceae bacterium SG7u.132]WPO36665.1 efflux RND transporter periplasmic adaptor subunit [Flammeovirgaceae bacterium SG7u.111]
MKNLSVILALALLSYACNPDYKTKYADDSPKKTAKPVAVQELEITSAPIPIEASGVLGSKAEVKMSFKIGGIIQHIYAEEGQAVKAGQVLAILNRSEINAQVSKAKNAVGKAKRDLDRAQNLYQDSVITLEQLQDLTTVFEVAKSELEIAAFNQTYSQITAPENGKILKRFAEEGELVNGGTPVFLVGNTAKDAHVIRIGVADVDIVRLHARDSAKVFFDAYPKHSFTAYVSEIAESADPRTGAFEIELTLNPSTLNLKNGFVGKVQLFPSNQDPYYKITMDALVEGRKETAQVFVLEQKENKVKKVEVSPSHIGEGYFTVLASSFTKAQVVTEGAAYLADGDIVEVVNY